MVYKLAAYMHFLNICQPGKRKNNYSTLENGCDKYLFPEVSLTLYPPHIN